MGASFADAKRDGVGGCDVPEQLDSVFLVFFDGFMHRCICK
jgi:hypothetical protein